jgi:hypothetical protein
MLCKNTINRKGNDKEGAEKKGEIFLSQGGLRFGTLRDFEQQTTNKIYEPRIRREVPFALTDFSIA